MWSPCIMMISIATKVVMHGRTDDDMSAMLCLCTF